MLFLASSLISGDWLGLAVGVHVVVVAEVVAAGDAVHPVLMVEVPADGLLDPFLKLEARFPA